MDRSNAYDRQKGFSLIEALAAIALIALALVPLLALQGQLSRTAISMERAEQVIVGKQNALAFLKTINPLVISEGQEDLGVGILTWKANNVSEIRPIYSNSGSPSRWTGQLFDIEAVIEFEDGRTTNFTTRKFGWRATEVEAIFQ